MEIHNIIWYCKLSAQGWRTTGAHRIITGNPLSSVASNKNEKEKDWVKEDPE